MLVNTYLLRNYICCVTTEDIFFLLFFIQKNKIKVNHIVIGVHFSWRHTATDGLHDGTVNITHQSAKI